MLQVPIGFDDFRELRQARRYFVDKSSLIAEFWRDAAKVLLLPRPRRFGKSLNMSMLKYFFSCQHEGRELFQGLSIEQNTEIMAEQGKYPVLHIGLKDSRRPSFELSLRAIGTILARAFGQFDFDHQQLLAKGDAERWQRLLDQQGDIGDLMDALRLCSQALHSAYGRRAIVLIDEYDVPLLDFHSSNPEDYARMVSFYRGFLGAALKDNPHLERGCLTGILRIARESTFSDLNNVIVYSLVNKKFNSCFGFTEPEVQTMLQSFSLDHRLDEVRKWYNGYDFGGQTIYNPWSVLSFIDESPSVARPYWIGSSANQLVKQLVVEQGTSIREQVSALISGQNLQYPLNEHIALDEVGNSAEQIWNFLTFTGYLKPVGESYDELNNTIIYDLAIPNREIRSFYAQSLSAWLGKNLQQASALQPLLQALQNLDWQTLEQQLNTILRSNASYFDSASGEAFYHALFIGMLLHLPNYHLQSNRESGLGRYDCALQPQDRDKPAFILEFKRATTLANSAKSLNAALKQIAKLDYAASFRDQGIERVYAIAVAVDGKQAKLKAKLIAS